MVLTLIEALACTADALLAGWFISSFCKTGYLKPNVIIFVVLYSLFNVSNLFIDEFSTYSTVVNTIGLMVFALFCTNVRIFKRILSAFIFEGTLIVVNTIIVMGVGYILGEEISVILNNQGIVRITMLIMSKLFIFMVLSVIKKLTSKETSFKYQDYFLLILFPIAFFSVFTVMVKISLSYNILKLYAYFIVAIFAIVFTYIGIYYLIYKINKTSKIEYEKEFYKKMLKYQQRHYLEAEENFKQIKRIKHNIKNSLLSVEVNLKSGDTAEAGKQLEKILASVSNIGNTVKSKNQIVDFVLNTKLSGITNSAIVVTGELADLTHIDDIDLSIILGNVVDNAVEAIADIQNAKIEIQFNRKNNYQSIIVKNSITESVLNKNPDLKSTKIDPKEHGIGVKSVKETVEKYGGTIEIFEDENFFNFQIVLPLNGNGNTALSQVP